MSSLGPARHIHRSPAIAGICMAQLSPSSLPSLRRRNPARRLKRHRLKDKTRPRKLPERLPVRGYPHTSAPPGALQPPWVPQAQRLLRGTGGNSPSAALRMRRQRPLGAERRGAVIAIRAQSSRHPLRRCVGLEPAGRLGVRRSSLTGRSSHRGTSRSVGGSPGECRGTKSWNESRLKCLRVGLSKAMKAQLLRRAAFFALRRESEPVHVCGGRGQRRSQS